MNRLRTWAIALALVALCLGSGCVFKPPILLEPEEAPTRKKALPLKCGLDKVTFRTTALSPVATWIFPFTFVEPLFPNARDESLYVRSAVITYFRDVGLFQYMYNSPFDPEDVDVVLDVMFEECDFDNLAPWSFIFNLPYLNILPIFGVPQEFYDWEFSVTATLRDARSGAELGRYASKIDGVEAVTLYEQPWGNYLWFSGDFKQDFYTMLDSIRNQIEAEAP